MSSEEKEYEYARKFLFEHSWNIYYETYEKQELEKWTTIENIGDFWRWTNNVWKKEYLTSFKTGTTFHFFRDGISPRWEDPANTKGGNLTILIHDKSVNHNSSNVQSFWEYLLMGLVGEQIDTHRIHGLSMCKRPNKLMIRIWERECTANSCEKAGVDLVSYLSQFLDKKHIALLNKHTMSVYYRDHGVLISKDQK